LRDPDADRGSAFKHAFGRSFFHPRLKHEGLEGAERGGDGFVAHGVDREFVDFFLEKNEGVAVFAGFKVPSAGVYEA